MNTDKTDAVELLTDAELDTALEVAKSAEVDEYVKTLQWSGDIDDYTKTLVIGNIRGYALRKTTPETPINKFINSLVGKVSQLTAENDRLKKEVEAARRLLEEVFIQTLCHHHLLFKLRDALSVDWTLMDESCAKCDLSIRIYKTVRPKAFAALEGDSQ